MHISISKISLGLISLCLVFGCGKKDDNKTKTPDAKAKVSDPTKPESRPSEPADPAAPTPAPADGSQGTTPPATPSQSGADGGTGAQTTPVPGVTGTVPQSGGPQVAPPAAQTQVQPTSGSNPPDNYLISGSGSNLGTCPVTDVASPDEETRKNCTRLMEMSVLTEACFKKSFEDLLSQTKIDKRALNLEEVLGRANYACKNAPEKGSTLEESVLTSLKEVGSKLFPESAKEIATFVAALLKKPTSQATQSTVVRVSSQSAEVHVSGVIH